MAKVQVERLFMVNNSVVMKQVEQFMNFTGLDFEPKAAKQWFTDLYSESDRAMALIQPLADKVKQAKALSEENKDNELMKEELTKLDEELTKCIREQVTLNIMTLPVKAKGK